MKVKQLAMLGVAGQDHAVNRQRKARVFDRRDQKLVGRVIHLGAGLQSSTLVEMVLEGELERADLVVFCDTKDEPSWVYDQVEYLQRRLACVGIDLVILARSDDGIVHDAIYGKGRFASLPLYTLDPVTNKRGLLRRQCTREYKIEPAQSYLRDWLIERGHGKVVETKTGPRRRIDKDVYVESWFGITLDEIERAGRRGGLWQADRYPLIERRMTRLACKSWLANRGLPIPRKSSCRVCPFHDDEFWLDLQINRPADFEHACRFDDWLRSPEAAGRFMRGLDQPAYLHRLCVPLREIDFAEMVAQRREERPLMELCDGYCMT